MESIKELQESINNFVVDFDRMSKFNYNVEMRYHLAFPKDVLVGFGQNSVKTLIQCALNAKKAGKTYEEIVEINEKNKKTTENNVIAFGLKHQRFLAIKDKYNAKTEEEINEINNQYFSIIKKYNVLFNPDATNEEKATMNRLRIAYLENDLEALGKISTEGVFREFDLNKYINEKDKLVDYYKRVVDFLSKTSENNQRLHKSFIDLESKLNDEMLCVRLESDLRQKNYKTKEEIDKLLSEAKINIGEISFKLNLTPINVENK